MSLRILYVSPHPDDVAFSAALQLQRDVAAGAQVTMVTLFEPDEARRIGEDRVYARRAGIMRVSGGFRDAPLRHPRHTKPSGLFGPIGAREEPLIEAVRARLRELVDDGHSRVVAPLGVGLHVDHQIAHAAARRLAAVELRYYEDLPYAFGAGRLARRLHQLGITSADRALRPHGRAAEWLGLARFWWDTPDLHARGPLAVAAMATAGFRRGRRETAKTAHPEIVAPPDARELKLAAAQCYPSQWPIFLPSLERLGDLLDAQGRAMGQSGTAERIWKFESR